MEPVVGFEPTPSCLQGSCPSHWTIPAQNFFKLEAGFEPATSSLPRTRSYRLSYTSKILWYPSRDSNPDLWTLEIQASSVGPEGHKNFITWRRGWDSNPQRCYPLRRFQRRCLPVSNLTRRKAEDLHPSPLARTALLSKQARFACPVDRPKILKAEGRGLAPQSPSKDRTVFKTGPVRLPGCPSTQTAKWRRVEDSNLRIAAAIATH